jgi:hypothetical protein
VNAAARAAGAPVGAALLLATVASSCRAAPSPDKPEAAATVAPPERVAADVRACRVIKLEGGPALAGGVPSSDAGHPLSRGDLLGGDKVELAPGGELIVKATVSGREIGLRGPAVARVCPDGEEEVRLSSGMLRGFSGPGVRPGAEVWVATPLGVVRYNDAEVEIEVAPPPAEGVSVQVRSGKAVFVPVVAGPRRDDRTPGREEIPILQGVPFSAKPALADALLAGALTLTCRRQAARVAEIAREVLSAPAGTLGERAAQSVAARRAVHAVCSSARAAAGLEDGAHESIFVTEIDRAEREWKAVPPRATTAASPAFEPRSD